MKITRTTYEEVTIEYTNDERGRVITSLDEGRWRVRYSGPVMKGLKCSPTKRLMIVYRQEDKSLPPFPKK